MPFPLYPRLLGDHQAFARCSLRALLLLGCGGVSLATLCLRRNVADLAGLHRLRLGRCWLLCWLLLRVHACRNLHPGALREERGPYSFQRPASDIPLHSDKPLCYYNFLALVVLLPNIDTSHWVSSLYTISKLQQEAFMVSEVRGVLLCIFGLDILNQTA